MLIRTMLRVNPDRRADIELIAGHWWLNFDQNLAAIQDLPENQVMHVECLDYYFVGSSSISAFLLLCIYKKDEYHWKTC